MTKPKTNLADLTNKQLKGRIISAEQRLHRLNSEMGRRDRITNYGTATPELHDFAVTVDATFWLTVRATDEADANRLLDESGWLEWYNTTPDGAITVDEWDTESSDPELETPLSDAEIVDVRADTNRRLAAMGLPPLDEAMPAGTAD